MVHCLKVVQNVNFELSVMILIKSFLSISNIDSIFILILIP